MPRKYSVQHITDSCGLTKFNTAIEYDTDVNHTSYSRVKHYINNGEAYSYTYDDAGNISKIQNPDGDTVSYEYDSLNQLIKETYVAGDGVLDVPHTAVAYTYDTRGNILSKTYTLTDGTTETINYGYTDTAWKDRLTVYNHVGLNFDAIGNPTTWHDGSKMAWQRGRQLASHTKNGVVTTYEYNDEGIRTAKVVGGVRTEYRIYDGTLRRMSTAGNSLRFVYGNGLTSVIFNGTEYWYAYNAQGDVVGLFDKNGEFVVRYTYDAWGRLIAKTGSLAGTLGTLNPFRYRGYMYDEESGFYYVSSRYYDPEIGRWLNVDSVIAGVGGSIQGYNIFAYCFNNPVNMSDPSGNWPKWIETAANWVNINIIQPVASFVADIKEDFNNYDKNNESEQVVLDSHYFSSYKGVPVFRIDGDRSGSFGAMFITRETNDRVHSEDVVKHEYGHTVQLEQLGIVKYALCIGLPSWQEWGSEPDYYARPWEVTADIFGGVESRNHEISDIYAGFEYLQTSDDIGPFVWLFIE